jgi:uncharacterized protein (TIGR00156 family)
MRTLVIALFASLLVACQSMKDSPVAATPIQAVLAQGKDDQRVVIRGQVVSKIGDERYVVGDNSGQIRVHIDDDAARTAALGIGTHVEIAGEVDTNAWRETTLKAERVAVMTPRPVAAPAPAYR